MRIKDSIVMKKRKAKGSNNSKVYIVNIEIIPILIYLIIIVTFGSIFIIKVGLFIHPGLLSVTMYSLLKLVHYSLLE
jgi:hypothetical protein